MGILAAVAGTTALVFLIIIILQMRDNGRLKDELAEKDASIETIVESWRAQNEALSHKTGEYWQKWITERQRANHYDKNWKAACKLTVKAEKDGKNWEQLYRTECKLRDGIRKQKLKYWKTQCNRARGQLGLAKLKGPK